MTEFIVLVSPVGRWYRARIERGTIYSHSIGSTQVRIMRPTAHWAKAAGERWIRRELKRQERSARRKLKARKVTGYVN